MRTLKTAFIATLLCALPAIAQPVSKQLTEGGSVPGGALVLWNGWNAKLLAEAGMIIDTIDRLRSKERPRYYNVSEETKVELDKILDVLPQEGGHWAGYSYSDSPTRRDKLIVQDDLKPEVYAKIKADYERVIRSIGRPLPSLSFLLAAYSKVDSSKPGLTYMLPDFEKLLAECDSESDPCWQSLSRQEQTMSASERKRLGHQRQALVLLHEYWMRRTWWIKDREVSLPEKLAVVLRMDLIVYRIITQGLSTELTVRYYEALGDMGFKKSGEMEKTFVKTSSKLWIKLLQEKIGRPPRVDEFFPEFSGYTSKGQPVDPSLVEDFSKVAPRIADHFDGLKAKLLTSFRLGYEYKDYDRTDRQRLIEEWDHPLKPLFMSVLASVRLDELRSSMRAVCEKFANPAAVGRRSAENRFLYVEPVTDQILYIECSVGGSADSSWKAYGYVAVFFEDQSN